MWCLLKDGHESERGLPAHLAGRRLALPLLQGLGQVCAIGRPGPEEGVQQQMDPYQQVWVQPGPGLGQKLRLGHRGLGHEPGCGEENVAATPARLRSLHSTACIRRLGSCQKR